MGDADETPIPPQHVNELAGFFAAHDRWLFGHACVRTQGDRELAADLVQDTFEAAAVAWPVLREHPSGRQRAWLLGTLAKKDVSDFRRQEAFRRRHADIHARYQATAAWWIRQAITRAMADQARTIRIPVHMVEVINKLARVQRQMLQDLGREPTPDELAVELDMTPEKVVEVQKYGREPISLHTPLGEDGDSEFGDLIEDSEAIQPGEAVSFTLLQEQLHSVLDTLSEREAGVVSMRFGLTDGQPKTLDEIGKVYGVTRERIRQIESKTMSKLRHPSRSQVLRDYLD